MTPGLWALGLNALACVCHGGSANASRRALVRQGRCPHEKVFLVSGLLTLLWGLMITQKSPRALSDRALCPEYHLPQSWRHKTTAHISLCGSYLTTHDSPGKSFQGFCSLVPTWVPRPKIVFIVDTFWPLDYTGILVERPDSFPKHAALTATTPSAGLLVKE